jgi:uncharacterized DUF497 family protein
VGDAIEFDWDEANTRHLAAHGVTPAEFEQVMNNDPADVDCEVIDGEERYRSVGMTIGGRILSVVWIVREEKIRAVTAFQSPAEDRHTFLEKLK